MRVIFLSISACLNTMFKNNSVLLFFHAPAKITKGLSVIIGLLFRIVVLLLTDGGYKT
jgi:hypothetical protein